jgi:hypothetical protein
MEPRLALSCWRARWCRALRCGPSLSPALARGRLGACDRRSSTTSRLQWTCALNGTHQKEERVLVPLSASPAPQLLHARARIRVRRRPLVLKLAIFAMRACCLPRTRITPPALAVISPLYLKQLVLVHLWLLRFLPPLCRRLTTPLLPLLWRFCEDLRAVSSTTNNTSRSNFGIVKISGSGSDHGQMFRAKLQLHQI